MSDYKSIPISCDGTTCGAQYDVVPAEIVGKGLEMVFIIGEAPYTEEVEQGRPFIGKTGKILRRYFDLENYQYVLFNSIMCKPYDTVKSKPTSDLIMACTPFRNEVLENMVKGDILICLGRFAQEAIFGTYKDWSEIPYFIKHPTKGFSVPVYVTYHPMATQYQRANLEKFEEILRATGVFKI